MIRKNFESWHDFYIPEADMCKHFVKIDLSDELIVASYAITHLNESYE